MTTHIPRITPATTAEFFAWLNSIHWVDVPTDLPMLDGVPTLQPEPNDPDDEPDDDADETTPRHHLSHPLTGDAGRSRVDRRSRNRPGV